MNKKRIFVLVLSLTMVFTTVFAGAASVYADDNKSASTTSASTTLRVGTTVTAKNVNSGSAKYNSLSYNTGEYVYVPIKMPKAGTVKINLKGVNGEYGTSIRLIKSASTNAMSIGYSHYISSYKMNDTITEQLSSGGTYYLEFYASSGAAYTTQYSVGYYPAGSTLKNKKTIYGSSPNKKVSYYKVSVPSKGYLTVSFGSTASTYPSFNVQLRSSKKKSYYSGYEYLSNVIGGKKTRIGVNKGTYYIAVKSSHDYYTIKSSFTKVKASKSGSSKKKAVSIKKKKTVKGVLAASSSRSDWYKFRITKTQTVKLAVSTKSSTGGDYSIGGIRFTIYSSSDSLYRNFYYGRPSGTIQPYTLSSGSKLKAGTYYIKVSKYRKGNGYYSIKWK